MGVVAYRDRGDTVPLRSLALSADMVLVKQEVDQMYADGGGDTPEGVGVAFEAVTKLGWRRDAARSVVWISDAPPHGVTDSREGGEWVRWEDMLEVMVEMHIAVHALLWARVSSSSMPTIMAFMKVAQDTGGVFQLLQRDDYIGAATVVTSERELDKQLLAAQCAQIVMRQPSTLAALSTDQLRVMYIFSELAAINTTVMDAVLPSAESDSYELRKRPLRYEDVMAPISIMPKSAECSDGGMFCALRFERQPPRGLLQQMELVDAIRNPSGGESFPLRSVEVHATIRHLLVKVITQTCPCAL